MFGKFEMGVRTLAGIFTGTANQNRVKLTRLFLTLLFSIICSINNADAQSGKIPPFSMLRADGTAFTAQSLPKGKPVVLIYFSPECDHCQRLMNDLFKRVMEFNKASLVMVTYLSNEVVKKFSTEYNVRKYPNVFVGTEATSFFLRNHYSIMNLPFTAMYDKNGYLVATFKDDATVNDISKRLGQLK